MNKHQPTWQQQKELLRIQADLVRLRLLATQLKERANATTPRHAARFNWASLVNNLPVTGLALKWATKPKRWRNKLLLGTLLGVAALWSRAQH